MQPYVFLPHTADLKFQAFGKTLEEAFSNAAQALTSIMILPEQVKPALSKSITVQGHDLKALLYNFLEEFIIRAETESFVLHDIKGLCITKLGKEYLLTALAQGDNLKQYAIEMHIKAVTYNDMIIREDKGGCMVQVVPDI